MKYAMIILLALVAMAACWPVNVVDHDPSQVQVVDHDPSQVQIVDHDPSQVDVVDHDPSQVSVVDHEPTQDQVIDHVKDQVVAQVPDKVQAVPLAPSGDISTSTQELAQEVRTLKKKHHK